jgi:hypothetical protein
MLKNSLKLASNFILILERILAPDGHIILIHSDLSDILGLSKQTLD